MRILEKLLKTTFRNLRILLEIQLKAALIATFFQLLKP